MDGEAEREETADMTDLLSMWLSMSMWLFIMLLGPLKGSPPERPALIRSGECDECAPGLGCSICPGEWLGDP